MAIKQSSIEAVYQSIIDTLNLVLNMPGAIWLLNDKNEMTIRASSGLPEDYTKIAKLSINEDAIASEVFRTGNPHFVVDIQTEPSWKYKEQAQGVGIKSAWVFPLYVRKKVVGVLDVYNLKSEDFGAKEEKIISSFAEQTALAVGYFEGFQLLNDVGVLVNSSLHQKQLFDEIMKSAKRVLDCEHVSLFLATQDERLLLRSSSSSQIARTEFVFGSGVAGWVANEKISVFIDDVSSDERFVPSLSDPLTERSMLVVPILRDKEKQLVGVISADKLGKAQFNEQDIALMEAFARQAAVALENADLLQQVEDRASAFKSLQEVGTNLLYLSNKPEELDRVLKDIAENAQDVLGADLIYVYEYNQKGNRFSLPPTQIGDLKVKGVAKTEIFEDDILYDVIQYPEPRYTQNSREDKTLTQPFTVKRDNQPDSRFVVREEIESSASLPLIAGDEHVGVLFVNFRTPQTFSNQQKELIELFANQLSIAIHNVRVYRFERIVSNIGRKLTSKIDLTKEGILSLIREKAGLVMDVDNMYIALYDESTDVVRFGLAYVNGEKIDVENDERWLPRESGRGKTEEIIRTGEPLFHQTGKESQEWYDEKGVDYVMDILGTWIGVPIIAGDIVLGVIAAYHPYDDYRYSYDDLEILEAIANQSAVALKNVELYDDIQRRQRSLIEISQAVNAEILNGETAILEIIREKAGLVMDVDNMYIALYDASTEVVRFGLSYVDGKRIDIEHDERWQPRKAGKGKTEEIIRTREPLFHSTKEESKRWYDENGVEYVGGALPSWVGVPIMIGDVVLGVIATYHPTKDYQYSGDDLKILISMANQAAVALGNARMVADLEHAQKRVANTEALLVREDLARDFVHSMNNMAGTIPIWVDLIKGELSKHETQGSEVYEYLERIQQDARELLAGAERLRRPLEKQATDVGAILKSISRRIKTEYQGNIEIECKPPLDLFHVLAIPSTLINALWNIVNNGIEAMSGRDSGSIKIDVENVISETAGKQVHIFIRDTGHGINEGNLAKVFMLNFSTKGEGHGYGLWRSKVIIDNLGGEILVDSDGRTGTTFTIMLPATGEYHD